MKHLIWTETYPRCRAVKEPIVFHLEGFEHMYIHIYICSIVSLFVAIRSERKNGKHPPQIWDQTISRYDLLVSSIRSIYLPVEKKYRKKSSRIHVDTNITKYHSQQSYC